jgi:3-hydroxyisobutyrate dehydrogenase-like beta-hydroxyacid dehydrogenase
MGRPMVENYATGRELFVYDVASGGAVATAEATGATALEDLATAASGGREACTSTTIRG